MPSDVRVGGAYLDFEGRNAKFLRAIAQNEQALNKLTTVYRQDAAQYKRATESNINATRAFRNEVNQSATTFRNLQRTSARYNENLRQLSAGTSQARSRQESFVRAIDNSQSRLVALNRTLDATLRRFQQLNATGIAPQAQAVATTQAQATAVNQVVQSQQRQVQSQKNVNDEVERAVQGTRQNTATTLGFDRSLRQVVFTLAQYALAATAINVVLQASSQLAFRAAANYEQAFTGVLKTVDEATDSFNRISQRGEDISDGIIQLAARLPVLQEELANIAEIAGQLGITGVQNLLDFTNVISRIAVSTDLTSREAAFGVARLANILGYNNPAALGSVLIRLGNTFAATESQILEYSLRIGGAGTVAGFAAQEVLAIGAAAAAAGIQSEAGGTSIQRIFLDIFRAVRQGGEELRLYGKIAGLSADEFSQAWSEDRTAAFTRVIQGIRDDTTGALNALEELGTADVRVVRYALAQANTLDTLTEAFRVVNEEIKTQAALVSESELFFSTFNNQIIQAGNNLRNIAIETGSTVLPFLKDLLETFNDLAESGREWTTVLTVLATVIGLFAGGLGAIGGVGRIFGASGFVTRTLRGAGRVALSAGAVGVGAGIAGQIEQPETRRERQFLSSIGVSEEIFRLQQEIASRQDRLNELNQQIVAERRRLTEAFGNRTELIESYLTGEKEQAAALVEEIEQLNAQIAGHEQRQVNIGLTFTGTEQELVDLIEEAQSQVEVLRKNLEQVADPADRQVLRADLEVRLQDIANANKRLEALQRETRETTTSADFFGFASEEELNEYFNKRLAVIRQIQAARELRRENTLAIQEQFNEILQAREQTRQDARRAVVMHEQLRRERDLQNRIAARQAVVSQIQQRRTRELQQQFPLTLRALEQGEVDIRDIPGAADAGSLEEGLESYRQFEQNLRDIQNHLENVENAANRVSQAFGNMIQGLITGTRDAISVLRSLLAQITQLALQNLLLRPLLQNIFRSIDPIFAQAFAGGGQSVDVGNVSSFRHGGLHRGGLAVVGEGGAELVDFSRPGRVYNHEELRAALNGSGTVVNFAPVIQTADVAAVDDALRKAYPLFEQGIKNSIYRDMGRPSTARQSIRGT